MKLRPRFRLLQRLRRRAGRYASVAQSSSASSSSTEALLPGDNSREYALTPDDLSGHSEPDIDDATITYTRKPLASACSTGSPPVAAENSCNSYPSLLSPVSITTENEEDEEWRYLGFTVIPIEDEALDEKEERAIWVNGFENLKKITVNTRDTVQSIKDKIAAEAYLEKDCALLQRMVLSRDADGSAENWSVVAKYNLHENSTINTSIHPRCSAHTFTRI